MPALPLPASTSVLIVGAGPTGLALACSLAQAGVPHVLIDALAAGQNASRAAVIHAHTLETLAEIGVADRLAAAGLMLTRFVLRDRDHLRGMLRFDRLPTPFPGVLMIPQQDTEALLAARLAELGGAVHRGVTAKRITQHADGARVEVEQDGAARLIEAAYVVGGDGMHSVVREAANIAFEGDQLALSFVLADVRMDWPLRRDEVALFFAAAGPCIVAPLPGDHFRIVAQVDEAPEHITIAHVQQILKARGPTKDGGARVHEIFWSSRFRIHHRLAAHYRNGRLFVMGDAAHVHSPAGGQGMNTGLVDAIVLGRLLGAVLLKNAPERALDLYEQKRRPAAHSVLALAGALTNMATVKSPWRRAARNVGLAAVTHLPFAQRRAAMSVSGLARREAAELPAWVESPAATPN